MTDGDKVDVLEVDGSREVISLAGIDAPENTQPSGSESARNLATLVA